MRLLEHSLFPPAQTSSLSIGVTCAVVLIGLIAVVAYGVHRVLRRRRLGNWLYLFGALCRAHALATEEIGLLRRIAEKHGLTRPDTLFVDRSLFDRLIDPPDSEFRPDDLIELRTKLFRKGGEPVDDASIGDEKES